MRRYGTPKCFYCDRILSRRVKTKDHLQPRSRNGSNKPHNIVNACRQCNTLKGCLSLNEFRCVMAYRHGRLDGVRFLFPGELRRQRDD
jgi:5-methylcytosine-specific restriction endonuclease McrA